MQTLKKFNNFVNEITATKSRLAQIDILSKYKEDEDIKYYLNFLLNPYITTGISQKKLNKMVASDVNGFTEVYDILEYIKVNNTGRDCDIAKVNYTRSFLPIELKDLYNKIITKNLPLGIDVKTVNKVMPGLIPEFKVMLANKYFDNPKVIEGKEFVITTKIDGMRCIMLKENDEVSFWSRQGQKIEGLVDLEKEAQLLPNGICLDGELIAQVDNISETYKQTMKNARTKGAEKHGLKMMVFDYMSSGEFLDGFCARSYQHRHEALELIFKSVELKLFELLPILYQGVDISKIEEILKEQVAKGEEGIMINQIDALYCFGRSNALLKVKLMKDLDLEVIGFEEGDNKLSGTLGALLVDYNGNTVKVGSGFSEELRNEIWVNKEEWFGRTVVIQYFEETENAEGGKSLRFPVYIDWRDDK